MDDFGIATALTGLYTTRDRQQRSQNELQTLSALNQNVRQQNADKVQAQKDMQVYDEKVSEFANKLLAPDRAKINQKGQLLSQKIHEQLRMYGGDEQKFLANGGHDIMADYKNSLINSDEAATYQDNQKNMEYILKVEAMGKGHLINANDRQNLDEYNRNGGGKITYTGMLNDVEMPDDKNYDWGTDIPAEDILDKNMMKVMGNYSITHPDAPYPPDRQTLIQFVQANYGGKGSNYQRQMEQKKMVLDQQNKMAELEIKALEEYAKAQKDSGKKAVGKDPQGNDVDEDGNIVKTPDQKTYQGQGGYTNLITTGIQRAVSQMPLNLTAKDYMEGTFMSNPNMKEFEKLSTPTGNITANFRDIKENALLFDFDRGHGSKKGSLLNSLSTIWNDDYSPAGARSFYNGLQPEVAAAVLGLTPEQINIGGRKLVGWQPNEDSFLANGAQAKDNEDPIDYEAYKGDWKIVDIINVGSARNEETKGESLVMNIMDGKEIDIEKTTKLHKGAFASESAKPTIIAPKMALALENEEGVRFYQVFDNNRPEVMNKINVALGDKANLAPVIEDQNNRSTETKFDKKKTENQMAETAALWEQMNGNKNIFAPMVGDLINHSATGSYDQIRNELFKSYPVAVLQNQYGKDVKPDDVAMFVKTPSNSMSSLINEYDDEGFKSSKGKKLKDLVKDYHYSNSQIIDELISWSKDNDPQNLEMLQRWKANVDYLIQNKVK